MKCPNCGYELPEGHLICEKCGSEIRMVPDYIPEEVTEDPSENEEIVEEEILYEETDSDAVTKKLNKQMLLLLIPVVIITVFLVFMTGRIYHAHSASWQYKMARKYMEEGDFGKARECLERSYTLSKGDEQYLVLIADSYETEGDLSRYRLELQNLILSRTVSEEVRSALKIRLCDSYVSTQEYQQLADYIRSSKDSDLEAAYGEYLAKTPVFTYQAGEYDEDFRLTFVPVHDATIYYTIDGTFPTVHSLEYKEPVELDQGSTVVSAICVNSYGVVSDVTRATYEISYRIPEEPLVNLQSGIYLERRSIVVSCEEGCSVYYTTNGSDPNETCRRYTQPIKLPDGITIFKFIAINDETFAESSIVSRTYECKLDAYE